MNLGKICGPYVVALLAVAASSTHALEIETRLNGLDVLVEPVGVEGVSSEKVDLKGVRAFKVTNRTNQWVVCEFVGVPEQTQRTETAALEPNDWEILRAPGKYTTGGPLAVLQCAVDSQNNEL